VTPGYDGVGIVDAVGDGVTDLAVGNSCALMPQHGCCSTHLVLPAKRVVNVEAQTLEKATPEKAVCVALTGVTAYQMLHRVAGKERLEKPDAAVLVHGAAGGTGAMIVELAKLAGVKTIIGTCSARNVDAVKAAGAVAIDYHTDWQTEVKSITNGRGVDAVLDAVVAGSYLSKGIACTARGGIYIAYGFTNSADPGTFSMGTAVLSMAHLALQNTWSCVDGRSAVFYNVAENRDKRPDEYAADVRELIGLIASGKLDPTVGKIWSFDQAKEALLAVESGTHRGKQVVRIST
jgi:NADPH:quinone reductase-like Zn-dependent oxidoreductase